MENRFFGEQPVSSKVSAPWMAFYLASLVGLMLGSLNYTLAEPITAPQNPVERQISAEPAHAAQDSGQISIPGTQSAVLTVGREIQTNVEMINRSQPAPHQQKKAAASIKPETEAGKRYYLELPAPKPAAPGQTAPIVKDAVPATAATVPVAPISEEMATPQMTELPQPIINLIPDNDPEALPLDLSGEGSPLSDTATNAMIRITAGLMAVLGLLLVFAKVVLPRLMVRHPEFFENLRRKNEQKLAQGPLDIPKTMAEKLVERKEPRKLNLFGKREKPAQKQPPAQVNIPERMEINGKQFNVLSSTPLGKDKDLHLVEIMGRQLVVATTPYTVSLIQDLTGVDAPKPSQDEAPTLLGEPEAPIAQLTLLENLSSSGLSAVETTQEEYANTEAIPVEPQVEAETYQDSFAEALDTLLPRPERMIITEDSPEDLDIQSPATSEAEFIRPKGNTYASPPHHSDRHSHPIDADALEPVASVHELAWSIAGPVQEEIAHEVETADLKQERIYREYLATAEPVQKNKADTESLPPSLESVVIMNDYDDVYGY